MTGQPVAPQAISIPADDAVIIFRTQKSAVRGRLVRLGSVADTILSRHRMPDLVNEALGEALLLAALTGSVLRAEGQISLQTRTDGAISFLVADYQAAGRLRGYARFDAGTLDLLTGAGAKHDSARILGDGHLAITIEEDPASDRYQGVIALDGSTLADGTAAYFEQKEALPTFVRAAVARHCLKAQAGNPAIWRWRAGGIMMQTLAANAEPQVEADHEADTLEHWTRVRMLAATIEDHELLDPALTPERLLLRLFHEEGVIVERAIPLTTYCRCSRDRISSVLQSFGAKELSNMRDEAGLVTVRCEFCAASYAFELSEIGEPPANG